MLILNDVIFAFCCKPLCVNARQEFVQDKLCCWGLAAPWGVIASESPARVCPLKELAQPDEVASV